MDNDRAGGDFVSNNRDGNRSLHVPGKCGYELRGDLMQIIRNLANERGEEILVGYEEFGRVFNFQIYFAKDERRM